MTTSAAVAPFSELEVVLSGERVSAVTAEQIRFTQTTYRRHMPGCGEGVPVWEFP
ncbi:hypothetical protein [Methylobacterium oxalidis]|uniref:hypothetical protein n=1 Tax=Methylobacterium oxalidis TaxID=944322 RepID=UPI003314519A